MKQIDFYSLPRTVQDRLIAAFGGEFEPKPLVARSATRATSLAWLGVSAAFLLLLLVVWRWGYGDLDSHLSRHARALGAVYVLCTFAAALGVSRALGHRLVRRGLPFRTGLYLFPANLIDARERTLRVFPLEQLTEVSSHEPRTVMVRFGSARFSFAVDPANREPIVEQVRAASARMKQPPDDAERRFLDPLIPPLVASPLASDVPFSPRQARWLRASWVIAAGVGLLGLPGYVVRDRGSDARMFATARARDDVASYDRYLLRGDAERTLVKRELLPRAALRVAVGRGSVEAVDEFIRTYPDHDIGPEVARARRGALEAALEQAKRPGTLGALMAFADRYPKHGLDEAWRQARHAIYAKALERYRAKMPAKNVQLAEFVERLLATAERLGATKSAQGVRGPSVEIRLERLPSLGFENAERQIRSSPGYGGPHSLPSRYLDAPKVEPYAKQAAQGLAEAFSREFDAEILTFVAGPPVDGPTGVARTDAPTLVVSYRIEPSGANYASRKPRCVIAGLAMIMKSTFQLPGDSKPLHLDHTVVAGVPVRKLQEHKAPAPPGSLEAAVYDAMLKALYEAARERFIGTWVRTAP